MHIAEGILPAEWAVLWAVPAAAGTAVGLRRLGKRARVEPSVVSLVGLMGAAVFAISLMPIPVPVAGSVSHPAGTPLAAIVVGPMAGIVLAAVSLLIQALFFAHGGLTTLGANIVSEGMVGSLVGFGVFWLLRRSGRSLFWAGFAAGLIGDLAVYMTTAIELALALFPRDEVVRHSAAIFLAFLPTQLPLALLEGVLTGGILRSLAELRPDVAGRLRLGAGDLPAGSNAGGSAQDRSRRSIYRGVRSWWRSAGPLTHLGVVAGLLAAGGLAAWGTVWAVAISAGSWVGLDQGVMGRIAVERGRGPWTPFVNTDVGDLLLYVFFLGALAAGAILGWIVRGFRAETAPTERTGRGVARYFLGGAAAVAVIAAVWAGAAPGLRIGPVSGSGIASAWQVLAHPTRQKVLSARGGDVVLFVFMVSGLASGMIVGWRTRARRHGRLRVRLPHLHLHDLRAGDLMTWKVTGIQRMDARVKLGAIVLLLVLNLLGGWAVSVALLVVSLAVLLFWQRVRLLAIVLRLVPALIVTVMLILLRGFTVDGHPLFSLDLPLLSPTHFTWEGMSAGAELGVVVLSGVSLMLVLGLTTPLPALLAALRWYRVPALLVDVGMLMYRYLFLFVEEVGRMRQAQRLRGPDVSWSRSLGGFGRSGAHLLVRSHDRSQRVYDAQRLRGGGMDRLTEPRRRTIAGRTW